MHDRDSQCAYILRVLSRGRTITAGQALKGYGIARLAARIKDLRKEGYDITTAMIPVTNRHGKQTRIAKYFMMSKRTTTGEE